MNYLSDTIKKISATHRYNFYEMKVYVKYFFIAIDRAMQQNMWIKIRKFFNIRLKYKYWKWCIKKKKIKVPAIIKANKINLSNTKIIH